jgi:hypothetical protein
MKLFASITIAGLLAACASTSEPQRVCTLIGCDDGLSVEVKSSLQQSFTVNVRTGTQTLHTFRCDPGQPCQAFVRNQTPAEVTVSIDAGGGQQPVSRTYHPEYQINRPNGPDCPPDCKQAMVSLTVS